MGSYVWLKKGRISFLAYMECQGYCIERTQWSMHYKMVDCFEMYSPFLYSKSTITNLTFIASMSVSISVTLVTPPIISCYFYISLIGQSISLGVLAASFPTPLTSWICETSFSPLQSQSIEEVFQTKAYLSKNRRQYFRNDNDWMVKILFIQLFQVYCIHRGHWGIFSMDITFTLV